MRVAVGILSVLLALAFLTTGGMKLLSAHMTAAALGLPVALTFAIGLLELAGAIGLIAGFWLRGLGAAAATGLVLLMIGALIYHAMRGELLTMGASPLILLILSAITAYLQRHLVRSRRHASGSGEAAGGSARQT